MILHQREGDDRHYRDEVADDNGGEPGPPDGYPAKEPVADGTENSEPGVPGAVLCGRPVVRLAQEQRGIDPERGPRERRCQRDEDRGYGQLGLARLEKLADRYLGRTLVPHAVLRWDVPACPDKRADSVSPVAGANPVRRLGAEQAEEQSEEREDRGNSVSPAPAMRRDDVRADDTRERDAEPVERPGEAQNSRAVLRGPRLGGQAGRDAPLAAEACAHQRVKDQEQ